MATLAYANGRTYSDTNGKVVPVITRSKAFGSKKSYAVQPRLEHDTPSMRNRNFR